MFRKRIGSLSFLLILASLMLLTIAAGRASADNALIGKWGYTVLEHAANSWSTWKTEAGTVTFNADGTAVTTYAESADTCPSADFCKASDTSNHNYTVNGDGTFTLDGVLRIVVSDDRKSLIMDSTSLDNHQALFVGVKMDLLKTYTNADINGNYYTGAYEYDALGTPYPSGMGNNRVLSMISAMSNGSSTSNGTLNGDGTILSITNQPGTYSVSSDGSMTINGMLHGYAGTGGLSIFSNAQGGTATDFANFVVLKKADKVYSTADLQGTWAMTGFGDYQKSVYRIEFGTITCGNTGNCTVSLKVKMSDGTTSILNTPLSMSLAADGSYNGFIFANDMPHFSGAIGSNGNAMILIMNNDNQSTNDRSLGVAVKCSTCTGLSPSSTLYAYFSGYGIHTWNGTAWTRIGESQPTNMVASGSTLYATFSGVNGIFKWDGASWARIGETAPALLTASGSTLYAYFSGYGIHTWNGTAWTRIGESQPTNMVASGSTLYATFSGVNGIFKWDGASWARIGETAPALLTASGSTLYAYFSGYGIHTWNGTAWTRIGESQPTNMVASGSTLYATFSGVNGIFKWDGASWARIGETAPALLTASGSTLYAYFSGYGIHTWNGTAWTRIGESQPIGMAISGN